MYGCLPYTLSIFYAIAFHLDWRYTVYLYHYAIITEFLYLVLYQWFNRCFYGTLQKSNAA